MEAQNILLLIIAALSILLVVLGVQAFLILKDVRKTINKANKVLDETGIITSNFSGLSLLTTVIKSLVGKTTSDVQPERRKERAKTAEIKVTKNGEEKKPARRFFRGIKRF